MEYSSLFEKFSIRNCEIKNRIVMTPMDTKTEEGDNDLTDKTIAYYEERAKGGVGLIVTGVFCQDDETEGGMAVHSAFKHKEVLGPQLRKLADACHKHGTKVFGQVGLNFGVIAFAISVSKFIAPSDAINVWSPEIHHHALTIKEIEKIIKAHGQAAKFFKDNGLDGVCVVGPYGGYLADQFAMEYYNHRTDKYGGSVENRANYTKEIIETIKKECGDDFPLLLRMGTKSHLRERHKGEIPGISCKELGRDTDESIKLAKIYEKAGADGFLIGNGTYASMFWQYSPMYMPEGEWLDEVAPFTKEMDVPVVCPGRILMPETANEAIKNKKVDAVALGRALLADPNWANKAKQDKANDIRPCIGCNNGCIGRVMLNTSIMCAVNTQVMHEQEEDIIKTDNPKKVVIVGAGIGGMEAARVLALRGHNVEIYEKSNQVGGIFVAAAKPEFKHGDERLISWYEKQLKDSNIKISFNYEMTKDKINKLKADEIIIATGSTPKTLPIPGLKEANTVVATDVLLDNADVGDNVLVMGAGLIGCEAALKLSENKNKKVTVVELARYLMTGGISQPSTPTLDYVENILEYRDNVKLMLRSKVKSIENGKALVETTRVGESEIPFDTIVLAIGLNSENKLYEELKDEYKEHIHVLGDAKAIGNIMSAIHEANKIAKSI